MASTGSAGEEGSYGVSPVAYCVMENLTQCTALHSIPGLVAQPLVQALHPFQLKSLEVPLAPPLIYSHAPIPAHLCL